MNDAIEFLRWFQESDGSFVVEFDPNKIRMEHSLGKTKYIRRDG